MYDHSDQQYLFLILMVTDLNFFANETSLIEFLLPGDSLKAFELMVSNQTLKMFKFLMLPLLKGIAAYKINFNIS